MIRIISDEHRRHPEGHRVDCRNIPNPHEVPRFRPRDGRDDEVKAWVTNTREAQDALANALRAIDDGATTIGVTCKAGRHRSVAMAEKLADLLGQAGHEVAIEHRAIDRKRGKKLGSTQRGYGHRHQMVRKRLLYNLTEGDPCDWCGKPMYRDPEKNFDNAPLEADHTKALKHHGPNDADRLVHRHCNRSRGDGRDERSPLNKAKREAEQATPAGPIGWDWLG